MKLSITAEKFNLSTELEKYAAKKASDLEKHLPRAARPSAHLVLHFQQAQAKQKKQSTCTLILHVPGEELYAQETTQHMYAALDVAIAHIEHQLDGYKAKHTVGGLRRRLSRKFRSR